VTVYNLLDYPCITLPITAADKTVDLPDEKYIPVNEADRKNHESYDPELYDGMPVCLQLVGQPLGEERLLNLARAVDEAIQASND
jgi:amidase